MEWMKPSGCYAGRSTCRWRRQTIMMKILALPQNSILFYQKFIGAIMILSFTYKSQQLITMSSHAVVIKLWLDKYDDEIHQPLPLSKFRKWVTWSKVSLLLLGLALKLRQDSLKTTFIYAKSTALTSRLFSLNDSPTHDKLIYYTGLVHNTRHFRWYLGQISATT